jgi:hypothetical protein
MISNFYITTGSRHLPNKIMKEERGVVSKISMIFRCHLLLISIFILFFQSTLLAQHLPEPLKKNQFEAGYSHYWYHGDFYQNATKKFRNDWWNNGTLYFRIGFYDVLSVSTEGMLFTVSSPSRHSSGSFWNLTMGLGLSSISYKISYFNISFHIHYLENLYIDRSEEKSDKRFRNMLVGIPLRYRITKNWYNLSIWIGTVYFWEHSEYLEDRKYSRSINSPGVSIGLDALISKHLYLKISTIYSDYFQPQISIGYRF